MERSRTIDWRIVYYILILVILILFNAALIIFTQGRVEKSNARKMAIQVIVKDLEGIESGVLRGWDIGLRGYGITRTSNMLDPYDYAFIFYKEVISRMREIGPEAGMDSEDIDELDRLLTAYGDHMRKAKALLDYGQEEEFRQVIAEDHGVAIWEGYDVIRRKYQVKFLRENNTMNSDLTVLQNRIVLTQGVSALFAFLLVFLIYRKIHSFAKQKQAYISRIEEANEALATHQANLENEVNWKTKDLAETNRVLQKTLEDMRTMQSYLLQSEKMTSLGTMTMGMAHEFNNALNQIKGGYHLFQNKGLDIGEGSDGRVELGEDAMSMYSEGVGRIEKIVKAMQVFAQVGSAGFSDTDFNDLLDKALVILGPKIDESLVLERSVHKPLMLKLQQANMLQVILQLLDNALYAVQAVHPTEKYIGISSSLKEDVVEISFINSGDAIPSASLREIFDPFFTTKDPGVGTGLGLSVCYSIVMAHGGEIQAENLDDHKVLFKLTLPMDLQERQLGNTTDDQVDMLSRLS